MQCLIISSCRIRALTTETGTLLGNIYEQVARAFLMLDKLDDAVNYCNKALKIKEDLHGRCSVEVVDVLKDIGCAYEVMAFSKAPLDEALGEQALMHFEVASALMSLDSNDGMLRDSLLAKVEHLQKILGYDQAPFHCKVRNHRAETSAQIKKLTDARLVPDAKTESRKLLLEAMIIVDKQLIAFYREKQKKANRSMVGSRDKVTEELLLGFQKLAESDAANVGGVRLLVSSYKDKIKSSLFDFRGVKASLMFQKLELALKHIEGMGVMRDDNSLENVGLQPASVSPG